ncbi:MAG: hypothetical protein ABMB14_04560 [Myxococcota bacterium]
MRFALDDRTVDLDTGRVSTGATLFPLALELVAVHAATLGPTAALAAIRAHGDASIEAMVAYTWDRLPDGSRDALRQLATFARTFTVDAAAAVLSSGNPLDTIGGLVVRGLLTPHGDAALTQSDRSDHTRPWVLMARVDLRLALGDLLGAEDDIAALTLLPRCAAPQIRRSVDQLRFELAAARDPVGALARLDRPTRTLPRAGSTPRSRPGARS